MKGEPAGWDGPGPAVEHLLPARAVVWVKTALFVPYTAVKDFYCHNGRSFSVHLGLSL